jgi:hypothetical protein
MAGPPNPVPRIGPLLFGLDGDKLVRIKSQKDFWAGLMFLLVGIAFAIGSRNYSFGSSARPGPAYFPFGLGVLMVLLALFILFESLTVETDDGEPIGPWAWKPLIIVSASIVIFGFMLPRLGMALTLPVLITLTTLAGEEFHWKDVVVNSIVLTVACWGMFIVGLKLTIPLWPTFLGN